MARLSRYRMNRLSAGATTTAAAAALAVAATTLDHLGRGLARIEGEELDLILRDMPHHLAPHRAEHLAHQPRVHVADVGLAVALLVHGDFARHQDREETHIVFLEDRLGILGAARFYHHRRQHVAAVMLDRARRIAQAGQDPAVAGLLDVLLDAGDR